MSKELNAKLNEELIQQLTDISEMYNDDDKTRAVEQFCSLYKAYQEGLKTEAETTKLKCESKNLLNEPKKERWTKIGIAAAGIVFNTTVLVLGLKFEETGTVTSGFFKWGLNHFCK